MTIVCIVGHESQLNNVPQGTTCLKVLQPQIKRAQQGHLVMNIKELYIGGGRKN
jgi:hypothetical protein